MSKDETRTPLRAAIYVRQSVREDQGIAQQIAECKRRAGAEQWQVVDVYNDNKISATKERGPGTDWARMLADIDAGRVDVVLAVTAARLLRRVVDVIKITKPERDVRIVTLRDGIDTANMGGRLMLMILVMFAEEEIAEKEARAIPYRAGRREAGHPSPGLVPFGYSWVPALHRDERGTRYVVAPDEAAALRFMSRELLGGASLGGIVAALNAGEARNEHGAPLGESSRTTREGKPWITTTVRRLLISPYPAALLPPAVPEGEHYNAARIDWSKCTPGAWEPIVSADAVLAARHKLLNASRLSHDGKTRAKWLLAGVGRCGKCKGPLRSCKTKTTAQSVRGYRCTAGCFQRPADPIEAYVAEAVVGVLSAPGVLQHLPDEGADVAPLSARRSALVATRGEWFERAKAGTLAPHEWDALAAQHDAEIREIDAHLAEALTADPLAEIVTSNDVQSMWDGMTTARRRAVLGALVHRVEVLPVGKGRRVVTVEQTEGTVVMGWKRAEQRVRFDRERSVASVTPRVPADAHDEIAAALNA